MYHAHFGLERPLFAGGIARDQNVFRSGQHERLVERYKLALASPSSVIALTGPPGIGKTTLTATALRASSPRVAIAWLHGLVTNGTELVELLLAELGLAAERTTRVERLQIWRQFHSEMAATESRVFVVAERADDLPVEVLRALDGLTAPDATGYAGVNLVLLGQARLLEHLEAPTLESLRQRIRLRAQLEPFTEAELQDYLRHQAACAGGDFDRVFAPGAVAALFRHSEGVARVANHLCETALEVAAGEREKLLTAAVVRRVATTILGLPEAAPAPAAMPNATPRVDAEPAAAPKVVTPSEPPVAVAAPAPVVSAPTPAPAPAPAPPVATHPVAPVGAPSLPVVPPTLPSPAPAPAAARAPSPAAPVTESTKTPEFEFDGSATEVPDVSVVDFPVLTDAVEEPPSRTAAPDAPDDADALRQTQTLRAIAVAKSIDDISSSMAETLFGEAELDVLQAALATSAAADEAFAEPYVAAAAPAKPLPAQPPVRKPTASTGDDLLDLLDLTSDATLELMDEPLDKPAPGRTAAQR